MAGRANASVRKAWQKRFDDQSAETRNRFERVTSGELPDTLGDAVDAFKKQLAEEKPGWATRKSSEEVLKVLVPCVPEMIGGSADLTGSNNTRTPEQGAVTADDFSGGFIHWGVREHGMAAAMNGMVLHGGFIPYSGTFLVFSDYSRPAIRLAALMQQRVVHVLTHDSIGLGEDGPTHQPVEHLAALRAMPNVYVMRPADAIETLECWQLALKINNAPSVLALTRQGLPTLRDYAERNLSALVPMSWPPGQRPASDADGSGSEVAIAMQARDLLKQDNISARVVSVPCMELLENKAKRTIGYFRRHALAYRH